MFFNNNRNNLIYVQKTKEGYKRYFYIGGTEFEENNNSISALRPINTNNFIHVNFQEFIGLNITVIEYNINGDQIYFRFGDYMTLEDFNKIIDQIQVKTELTNNEVLQFMADLLLCEPNEVFNNIDNIFMIGINYKSKDFKVYLTKENIKNIQDGEV